MVESDADRIKRIIKKVGDQMTKNGIAYDAENKARVKGPRPAEGGVDYDPHDDPILGRPEKPDDE